jgi:UDP-glucose 4-epimerase
MYKEVHGIDARILRVANAYGPDQPVRASQGAVAAFLSAARDGREIVLYGDGHQLRDFVLSDDVADAVVELVCRPTPLLLNVGTGVGVSIAQLVELVESVTGRSLAVDRRPPRGFDVEGVVLDLSALRAIIDWRPALIEEGLERCWRAISSMSP